MSDNPAATSPFHPRFDLSQVQNLAGAYRYKLGEIPDMSAARNRAFYTRDEFLELTEWKSPRSKKRLRANSEAFVVEATRNALRTRHERLKIHSLLSLEGVAWPVASALLHAGDRRDYPILDFRALWSLGLEKEPKYYSFDLWWDYVEACREISRKTGVSIRELDKALWQYSNEHQPATKKA